MTLTPSPIVQGCWVDVFQLSQFRGPCRRLYGPGDWPSLRSRRPDWGLQIDSLVTGPSAHVVLYEAAAPHTTAKSFLTDERIADLLEHVKDDHDSLRLLDAPPDSTDPMHSAYLHATQRRQA